MSNAVSFLLCKGNYTKEDAEDVEYCYMSDEVKDTLSAFIEDSKDFCANYLANEPCAYPPSA
ncbi:MAG: hypothetical protein MRQ09_00705 [Candidatus Midichloria sp.]|nr:hypothetical protein [Candidatus Midichloria sp.]